jgi:hypothetical protein
VCLVLEQFDRYENRGIEIPLAVEISGDEINTLVLSLEYEPAYLSYRAIEKASLSEDFLLASNGTESGKVHIAMACVNGIKSSGEVLRLMFEVADPYVSDLTGALRISQAWVNDLEVINYRDGVVNSNAEVMAIPKVFGLSQSYPNPFNPEVTIGYQLPTGSMVSLRIYSLLGQEIRVLVDGEKEAGYHRVSWDGKDASGVEVSSGVYLYTIEAGHFRMTRKMVRMQ